MRFFSTLRSPRQVYKPESKEQCPVEAETEGKRLLAIGSRLLRAIETEQRLASCVERYRHDACQDQTLLAEWYESRAEVDRAFNDYVAALKPYHIAAVSAGDHSRRKISFCHRLLPQAREM